MNAPDRSVQNPLLSLNSLLSNAKYHTIKKKSLVIALYPGKDKREHQRAYMVVENLVKWSSRLVSSQYALFIVATVQDEGAASSVCFYILPPHPSKHPLLTPPPLFQHPPQIHSTSCTSIIIIIIINNIESNMSTPDENWGGDDSTISGPSQAAETAVVGEEGAIIFDIDKLEKAREAAGVTMVGTPSSEAATVQLKSQDDTAPKPRRFVQHNTSEDPALEPQNYDDHFSSNPHRNVNPAVNTQERYRGDRPKIAAEDNVASRFELFLLGDGEKKVTEAPDTRKSSTSTIHHVEWLKLTLLQVSPHRQSSPSTRKITPSAISFVPASFNPLTSLSRATEFLTLCLGTSQNSGSDP